MRYRLLEVGEIIKAGDLWYKSTDAEWKTQEANEYPTGKALTVNNVPFCRPIEEPNTKFCQSCNGESHEGAKFCQHCGKEFPKPLYRLLREREKLQMGDEYWYLGEWKAFEEDAVKHSVAALSPIRRKIKSYQE